MIIEDSVPVYNSLHKKLFMVIDIQALSIKLTNFNGNKTTQKMAEGELSGGELSVS
jgi:hypothetical protein